MCAEFCETHDSYIQKRGIETFTSVLTDQLKNVKLTSSFSMSYVRRNKQSQIDIIDIIENKVVSSDVNSSEQ